jgi:hypothetical protein
MPSTGRFPARPIWACLEPCPLREITSFELDSSQSRKSVFSVWSHTYFWDIWIQAKLSTNCKREVLAEKLFASEVPSTL